MNASETNGARKPKRCERTLKRYFGGARTGFPDGVGATLIGANIRACAVFLLPLPACGVRVGVRGPLHKGGLAESEGAFPRSSDSRRGPLTPNLREERANS